jgi:hypothetical protein
MNDTHGQDTNNQLDQQELPHIHVATSSIALFNLFVTFLPCFQVA